MHVIFRFKNLSLALACVLALQLCALAQSTGGVKGKIRDWNGTGIAGISVSARQKGVDVKTVRSGKGGEFVLDGLAPGVYNIAFDGEGYSTGVLYNVEIKAGKVRGLSERLLLTRDRGAQVFVKGLVFYRDKTSAAGANVELYVVNDDGSERKIASTTTDVSGDFSFPAVNIIKKMRVKAVMKGVSETKDIDVNQPQVYRTSIILPLDRPAGER